MGREFEGKKLLLLGGIKLACDIVERAHELGAYVAVADYYSDSPAKMVADEAVLIDATDVEALVDYCKANNIDGVTTGFVDILMPVCYEVCKRLNLPYYATPKMLSMSTNKIVFKETCKQYGIPVPQTYLIGETIADNSFFETIQYPVFVKPLDSSGSRGAGVCYTREEVIKQFEVAKTYSPTKTAIIEDYITGTEFLLDYIAVGGEFRLLSMFDRFMCDDRDSARNYANISMAPSRAIDSYLNTINDRVTAMFKDLGFKDGLIFLQGHTEGNKITFYEMGCRLGGSFYKLEQNCIGLNPIDMTIRYAFTGKMLDHIENVKYDIARFNKFAFSYNCLLGGSDETVASIKGLDMIDKLPSYVACTQQRGVGTYYKKDGIVDKPLITIYLATEDFAQAKKDIKTLNEEIEAYNSNGDPLLLHRYNPDEL